MTTSPAADNWIVQSATMTLAVNDGVTLRAHETIEVSMYCDVCDKPDRTIAFSFGGEAICHKTNHPVPGTLSQIDISQKAAGDERARPDMLRPMEIRFVFTHPNADDEIPSDLTSDITWGRINLTLGCPKCGTQTTHSTQNNIVRPLRIACQKCDFLLAIDEVVQPAFSIVIPAN